MSNSVGHSTARTLAALLGAPVTAAVVGGALARFLPLSREASTAWGYHLLVPLWVLLACVLPLQRSWRHAWLLCAIVSLTLSVASLLAGPLP